MDTKGKYYRQVQLLLQLIPFVTQHDCFALKGGTAINLFVRDFPRLSVDIDLVFLPMSERAEALATGAASWLKAYVLPYAYKGVQWWQVEHA